MQTLEQPKLENITLYYREGICDKLVTEQMTKGYPPGEDGTPYRQPDVEERFTGILPQLLNPIDEGEANRLMNDPAYVLQQNQWPANAGSQTRPGDSWHQQKGTAHRVA